MSTVASSRTRPIAVTALLAVVVTVVVASVGNTAVSVLAQAAGASGDFRPLQVPTFVSLTIIGVLAGVVGWLVVRRTARPHATMRWLVPVVIVVSWVPDLLLGIGQSQPHTSWTGVTALMAMHLVVAAVALPVFARLLPLPADRT